ncbi:toprim domain-containing protein [Stutzerimonas stutzeri]|uniref:toprim domain-containing protein n=1 Tax=Stutzerimonas sp. S1 TaxID=3030652 RepID=UPI002223F9AA|nr:toprim domain-containing protein [Stutzerimonas sp. S1]MCW3149288.1 toprim domain-containing protein [Stutzerimonas sp. S1]
MISDPVALFRGELVGKFGQLDLLPIPDGKIHRFHIAGDRADSRNGWYVLHASGLNCAAAFGSWKTGERHTWSSRKAFRPIETGQLRQQLDQARHHREAERCQRQQAAARYACQLWSQAGPAEPHHPYLANKRCQAHNLRQRGGVLLVPLYHAGELVNLQRIHGDGNKRFLRGGRITGCYAPLGNPVAGKPLYICEGWATGATLHESTGSAVACAMNAGNLLPAGQELQRRYPDTELIIAGDDDRQTSGNPGRTAATAAANTLSIGLVFPAWPENAPLSLTDFNDLRQWREVRA